MSLPLVQKKSEIWLHFEVINEKKAKCNICRSVYSYSGGSTSNLRKHLRSKHPLLEQRVPLLQNRVLDERTTAESSSATRPIAESEQQPEPEALRQYVDEHEPKLTIHNSCPTRKSKKQKTQSTLNTYITRPTSLSRHNQINNLILNMIIKDFQPFSIINDTGFLELLKGLEPSYRPPSRNTFTDSFLNKRYCEAVNAIQLVLEKCDWITLTTDAWTSITNQSYMAVTAHFISEKWELISCLLDCFNFNESHTAQNICDKIKTVTEEWKIADKINVVVTDNAANIKAAIRLLDKSHIPCFAHTLNLIVQKSLKIIRELHLKIKKIVDHFHRSAHSNNKLLSTQTRIHPDTVPLKLKNDVVTRCNSTYYMFERFIKLEESLVITIGLLHSPLQMPSQEEWKSLKEICRVLQPFEQITSEMSSEKSVTISKVFIIVRGLISLLKQFETDVQTNTAKLLIEDLLLSISQRFEYLEFHSILSKASLLDPRFKQKAFTSIEALEKVKSEIEDEAYCHAIKNQNTQDDPGINYSEDNIQQDVQVNLIWQYFDNNETTEHISLLTTVRNEIRMYLEEPTIMRTQDPLTWWKNRCAVYPILSELGKKYLSVVATSVPSERIFSKTGQIINERGNKEAPEHVREIIFLHHNYHLLN